MSLADELLADLEEIAEEVEPEAAEHDDDDVEEAMEVAESLESEDTKSVKHVAKLWTSDQMKCIIEEIEKFTVKPRTQLFGPVETDPEYQLIVEANNITAEIDNEINIIHKYTRDVYSKRFPELESLVPNALDYIRLVQLLGNELEATKVDLTDILPPATKMVVSVTASTTQGDKLDADDLDRVMEACEMALNLTDAKIKIFQYVESRMSFIAPNLSIIIGASSAAKIMGSAGGLTSLSKMPACNILVLGAQRRTLSGFSSASTLPHTGHIYYSDLVQAVVSDLRRKAARVVSAKCSLAARVDACHESTDGQVGQTLRDEVDIKLEKMQEPPPPKEMKALPRPDDAPRKRRGGRRVRRNKEKYALTEMRKQANRVSFGKIEEDVYQTDLGFSVGTLGRNKEGGRIRTPAVDKKTQVSISKRLQRSLQQSQSYGGSTTVKRTVSGTASSVAFTPLQGLEIVNPNAAEKRVAEANAKYFSSTAGFLNVQKK